MKKTTVCFILFLTLTSLFAEKTALQKRNDFIASAKKLLGTPYLYGGSSEDGIDCSGLIYVSARDSGLGVIPRTAEGIYNYCTPIKESERQAGDLLFFTEGSKVSHVAIFLGDNQFIHSASEGRETGVIISKLSENYWKTHYYASGRLIKAAKEIARNDTEEKPAAHKTEEEKKPIPDDEGKYSKWEQNDKNEQSENFFTKYFSFTTAASVNLSFIGAQDERFVFSKDDFYLKGFSLQLELTAKKLPKPISVFARTEYVNDNSVLLPARFYLPIGLKFSFNKYISLYTGIVLNGERYSVTKPVFKGSDCKLSTPLFPGIFGLALETPKIKIGRTKISLSQELFYTHHTAAELPADISLVQYIATGVETGTFLRIEIQ